MDRLDQSFVEAVFPISSVKANQSETCLFKYDSEHKGLRFPLKRGRPKKAKVSLDADPSRDERLFPNTHQTFQFVPLAGPSMSIGSPWRKKIRRHVMCNRARSKHETHELEIPSGHSPLSRIICPDPFDVYPIRMEPYMLSRLKFYITIGWKAFYSIEELSAFNPMTDYWLTLAMVDDAFLHTLIGCAESHFSTSKWTHDRLLTVKHLNEAISIVNRRIANIELLSEGTLVVIATIAIIEKFRGAHQNWQVHMAGLKKLVEIRGGLKLFETKPFITQKILRADLYGSVDSVQKPYFSDSYPFLPVIRKRWVDNGSYRKIEAFCSFDATLKNCVKSLAEVSDLLRSLRTTKGSAEAAEARYLYTCTRFVLLSTDTSDSFHEICRLALILFSENMVIESPPRVPVHDILISKFRHCYALDDHSPYSHLFSDTSSERLELILWALFLAANLVISTTLRPWCLSSIFKTANGLGKYRWEDVKNLLATFPQSFFLKEEHLLSIWNEAVARPLSQEECRD